MEANNNNAGDAETEAKMAKSVTFETVATGEAVLDTKVEQEQLGTEMETDMVQDAAWALRTFPGRHHSFARAHARRSCRGGRGRGEKVWELPRPRHQELEARRETTQESGGRGSHSTHGDGQHDASRGRNGS